MDFLLFTVYFFSFFFITNTFQLSKKSENWEKPCKKPRYQLKLNSIMKLLKKMKKKKNSKKFTLSIKNTSLYFVCLISLFLFKDKKLRKFLKTFKKKVKGNSQNTLWWFLLLKNSWYLFLFVFSQITLILF
jgi:hypothetical protein